MYHPVDLTMPLAIALVGAAIALLGYKLRGEVVMCWPAALVIGFAGGWVALSYAQAYDSAWVAQHLLLEKWTGAIEIGSAGLVGLIVGLIALFLCGFTKQDLPMKPVTPHQAQ
jgi:energy-converting hydrogenase Eha subunit G